MPLEPGLMVGGKYRLLRRLATGGQGSVWTAEHAQLGSHVAIKFLDFSHTKSQAALTRFEREAKAAAKIRHKHLVHVEDVGIQDDLPYLVMELFEGEDLLKRIKTQGRLPLDETARIVNQVARGLKRLHDEGYVHRDLKPGNIFLAKSDDGEEIVKILDFGILKDSGAIGEGTKTGEIVGSPHYMSPEQIQNAKTIDLRSDLWSLGIVMYRAVTGQLPFPGEAIGALVAQIFAGETRRPSEIVPSLSRDVDAFFAQALARDLNQRFQSATEMAEAFSRVAGVRAPLPSIMESNMGWDNAPNAEPGSHGPNANPMFDAQLEATTMPRLPRPAGAAAPPPAVIMPPAPHAQHASPAPYAPHSPSAPHTPTAGGYPQAPQYARHSSDPMFHGGSAPPPSTSQPPSSAGPGSEALKAMKGTQPLRQDELVSARGQSRTVRIPIAERSRRPGTNPEPGPPPSSVHPGPSSADPLDPLQGGGGGYRGPAAWPTGEPPRSSSEQAFGAPSSRLDETYTAGMQSSQRGGALRGKGIWIVGGLVVGGSAGVIIAILVKLLS